MKAKQIGILHNENGEKNLTLFSFIKNNKKKILYILLSSFLFAFATTSLLTKASTIPSGLSAISITTSFIFPILKPYLNFIYLGLNIPLFIIFWKKSKKTYMYLTLLFLIFNAFFSFLIGFDFGTLINGKEMSLDYLLTQYVFVFCPPTSWEEQIFANQKNINNLITIKVSDFQEWLKEAGQNDNLPTNTISGITIGVEKGWPIFVYSLCAVTISAIAAAIAWKLGGSTGGTDIIVYYYSTKKKKPVGSLLLILGAFILAVSSVIVWSLSEFGPLSIKENINGFEKIISLQTLSSIIYVVLFGKIINMIYPKYEKVIIRIDTTNLELMKSFFVEYQFNHPYKIYTLTSGRTYQNIYTFETIVLVLESEKLIEQIKSFDPSAWISKLPVNKIYGNFDYSAVE